MIDFNKPFQYGQIIGNVEILKHMKSDRVSLSRSKYLVRHMCHEDAEPTTLSHRSIARREREGITLCLSCSAKTNGENNYGKMHDSRDIKAAKKRMYFDWPQDDMNCGLPGWPRRFLKGEFGRPINFTGGFFMANGMSSMVDR